MQSRYVCTDFSFWETSSQCKCFERLNWQEAGILFCFLLFKISKINTCIREKLVVYYMLHYYGTLDFSVGSYPLKPLKTLGFGDFPHVEVECEKIHKMQRWKNFFQHNVGGLTVQNCSPNSQNKFCKSESSCRATDFAHIGGVPPIEKLPKSFANKFANLFVRFFGSSELLK